MQLSQITASKRKGLTIAHINICGLINKIDQVRHLLVKNNIKILHILKTYLLPNNIDSIDSNVFNIPNYNLAHRDMSWWWWWARHIHLLSNSCLRAS